jgi:hypothetical protein
MTPESWPSRVTTTCRMPWRAIASAASTSGASSSRQTGSGVMSLPIGVSMASCGSVTRASTSGMVKMPTGTCFSSTTTIEPMRLPCIARMTLSTGASARQLTGARAALRSGASMSASLPSDAAASARRARCDRSSSAAMVFMQKSRKRGFDSTSAWNPAAGNSQQKQSCSAR